MAQNPFDFIGKGLTVQVASPAVQAAETRPTVARSGIIPWKRARVRRSLGHWLIGGGLILSAFCALVWFLLGEAADSLANDLVNDTAWIDLNHGGPQQAMAATQTAIDAMRRNREKTKSGLVLQKLARFVGAGFFVGFFLVVSGFAKLFLDKQSVFEQHVNEQLSIHAGGNVDATQLGKGAKYMGDKTQVGGDVIGSAVGKGAALHARDMTIYRQVLASSEIDAELKQVLLAARETIAQLLVSDEDRNDLADDLGKLTDEFAKPAPEQSRIARFLARIKEVAPSVESILMSAARVTQLLGLK